MVGQNSSCLPRGCSESVRRRNAKRFQRSSSARNAEALPKLDAARNGSAQANVFLKASDGAIGAHTEAVRTCYNDFRALAEKIYPSLR